MPTNHEERLALTHAVVGLLDEWGVADSDQISILGLPQGTAVRSIRKFRRDTPLPDDDDVMQHLEHLVGIADALRTTFPRNSHMAARWMNNPHKRLNQRTPIQTMISKGLMGLVEVRAELDCSFAWRQSDKPS